MRSNVSGVQITKGGRCLHDAVEVRAQNAATEESEGITDVTDGMSRDWLDEASVAEAQLEAAVRTLIKYHPPAPGG